MTIDFEVMEIQTAASPITVAGPTLTIVGARLSTTHTHVPDIDASEMSVAGPEIQDMHAEGRYVTLTSDDWTASAPGSWGETGRYIRRKSKFEVLQSAERLLSGRTSEALNLLLSLIRGEAERLFIPVVRTEVKGHIDQEEGDAQVVVTQYVNMHSRAALKYWDAISLVISFWTESLPVGLAFVVNERLDLEVRWIEPTFRST